MTYDLWLPSGYILPGKIGVQSLLFAGEKWQIFNTEIGDSILVARPDLAQRWIKSSFLDEGLFTDIEFGDASYIFLCSRSGYLLEPVEGGSSPSNKMDALSFALAMRETRNICEDSSFHDSIFVEQYSRLLPTWTLTPQVEDAIVLGTWISGGVVISTNSFRRLSNLSGWLSPSDLTEIVESAGLNGSAEAELLTKRKPRDKEGDDKQTAAEDVSVKHEQSQENDTPKTSSVFSLPGRPQLEAFFNEHIIDIIFHSEKYQALGIDFPSAIVLHGPPGCGKTYAVERLVEFIDWPCYSIDSNSVGSPYIHETSKKISSVFDKAIEAAPSVLVIDEMESFLSDRQSSGSTGRYHVEEVAEFLRRIPEAIKQHVLIFAMTNMIDLIDPAILRRGRFDHVIEVGMPSRTEVTSLLESLLKTIPCSNDLCLDGILDVLTGKPLSDSAFVVREAARLAAKSGETKIDQESINAALNSIPPDQQKKARQIGFVRDS